MRSPDVLASAAEGELRCALALALALAPAPIPISGRAAIVLNASLPSAHCRIDYGVATAAMPAPNVVGETPRPRCVSTFS